MGPVNTTGDDTHSRLLTAAEELIAEQGVARLSLREISRVAGAKNINAPQYWFTDKNGLLLALLNKHRVEVEAARHALLDGYEADPDAGLRNLAAALVRPWSRKLEQGLAGSGYLRTLSELLNAPHPSLEPLDLDDPTASVVRWSKLLGPHLQPVSVEMHRRFLVVRFVVAELALRSRDTERSDHRLFVSQLIDAATGLLEAPVSSETSSLYDQRRPRRRPRTG